MVKKAGFQAKIGGIGINSALYQEVLRQIIDRVSTSKKTFIVTPNPEFIIYAQKHFWFKKVLNQAHFAISDGIGLVWASHFLAFRPLMTLKEHLVHLGGEARAKPFSSEVRLRSEVIQERISGTDLMEKLCQEAAKQGWSVYFFGGQPGVAKKTLKVLQKRYPGLKGWAESGSKPANHLGGEAWITKISQKKPDLLFVAFGMGKQEKFIADNWDQLKVKLAMGVGGAFDFISGQVTRAPKWVQKAGLEWLYRLIREPWRWKRQLALIEFVGLVIKEKMGTLKQGRV